MEEWYIQARKAHEDNIVLFESPRFNTLEQLTTYLHSAFSCITDSVCLWIYKNYSNVGYYQRQPFGFDPVHIVNGKEILLEERK